MSYSIKPGNLFGRIGTELGKGLAEQIPKEVERTRLAQGLEALGQEQGLTRFQQLGRLATLPGTSPQLIQSGGRLLEQEAKSHAFGQPQGQPAATPKFPEKQRSPQSQPQEKNAPSLTTEETLQKAQEGYIPKTRDEIVEDARQKYSGNEAFYNNDPQAAITEAETAEAQREKIAAAYQKKHENLSAIQDNVVNRLGTHTRQLGVDIPANVYSKIEDKAIQATKPKDQGGEGLTEQQAMKKYGPEMDAISRDYKDIDSIGNWQITGRPAKETLRSMKSLQQKFDERDDTENLADKIIAKNKVSPILGYAIAQPVSKVPALSNEISKLPKIEPEISFKKGYLVKTPKEYIDAETIKAAERLSKHLKSNDKASPLATAYELEKKGYSASTFLDYLVSHREDLNLKSNQDRQLDKPLNTIPTLNDWWLSEWTGL
jgi:hypothetical protein